MKTKIKLPGKTLDGEAVDLELEVLKMDDGKVLVIVPHYISSIESAHDMASFCLLSSFIEDIQDMKVVSSDGKMFYAVDKHLKAHGRLFESDAELFVNQSLHELVAGFKSTGSFSSQIHDALIEIGWKTKEQIIQMAGDKYIAYSDPRYIEYIKGRSRLM